MGWRSDAHEADDDFEGRVEEDALDEGDADAGLVLKGKFASKRETVGKKCGPTLRALFEAQRTSSTPLIIVLCYDLVGQ